MNKFNIETNKQTPVAAAIHQTNVNKDSVIKPPVLLSHVWIWKRHFGIDANVFLDKNILKVDYYRKLDYSVPATKINNENHCCVFA